MRRFLMIAVSVLCLLFLMAVPSMAQSATQMGGVGINWNQYNTPQISGDLFYAHKMLDNNDKPTYNFNIVDVTSKTSHPFTANISITPGVAQQVLKFNGARVFALAAAGPSIGGSDSGVGLSWTTGGAVSIPYKSVVFIPMFRTLKTSTDSSFQAVFGFNIAIAGK